MKANLSHRLRHSPTYRGTTAIGPVPAHNDYREAA